MIEFDVLPEDHRAPETRRLRARARLHARRRRALTLEEGLAHLAGAAFARVELDVDLKLPGYEARVVDALRAHGLIERTLISTLYMRSLVVLRELEPRLRLGWSVPRVRRDYTTSQAHAAARVRRGCSQARRRLPRIAAGHIRAGPLRRADGALAARHAARCCARCARRAATSTCGRSTTASRSARLEALGVTGVITNDPRLFERRLGDLAAWRR